MGDIFSEIYYVQYDYSARTVGFNGFVIENLPVINEKGEKSGLIGGWTVFLIILIIAAVIASGYYGYKLKKQREVKLKSLLDMYEAGDEDAEKKIHQDNDDE